MARPKKITEKPSHTEIHEGIRICSREMYDKSCNDEESKHALLVAINGWLNHIDECLSIIVDNQQKGGTTNAKTKRKGVQMDAETGSEYDA